MRLIPTQVRGLPGRIDLLPLTIIEALKLKYEITLHEDI